jgi:hypothetical protein
MALLPFKQGPAKNFAAAPGNFLFKQNHFPMERK